jgi:hypothetical protein
MSHGFGMSQNNQTNQPPVSVLIDDDDEDL